jgi:hypothetical protein
MTYLYLTTLATSTLIKLFSEMLNIFFQIKHYVKEKNDF